ncbi:CPBP family intramembrane glutamic endopeptidase [Rothia sp. P7181]|uniref:CPBP family intramembrane glutamic endopeptidase n=1 Tax=Rothia sp. P7181 TaxID=3402663 RepID=UPI003AE2AF8E
MQHHSDRFSKTINRHPNTRQDCRPRYSLDFSYNISSFFRGNFFRGILIEILKSIKLPLFILIFISSILFTVGHTSVSNGFIFAFIFGLANSLLYLKFGIHLPILIHIYY